MAYTTIDKGSKYFNTVTYAGAGTSTQSVTGVGFAPDLIWIKNRTDGYSHVLQDVCRGFGATKNIGSNRTEAEGTTGATGDNYGHVSTSDSDGFTVTHTINASDDGGTIRKGTHFSGNNYVSWNWDANGTGVSNTSGSITSTVSANTTSGFSIVSYSGNGTGGATVGHGLGVAPKMIIIKGRATTFNWVVGHNSLSTNWGKYLTLSTTDAVETATNVFNDTAPTSSLFSIGTALGVNTSSSTYIAYCFAEVKGFSKFGSYIGNGSANGTFVYTGFKPAFILIKRDVSATNWLMYDNKRDPFNVMFRLLQPNGSAEEATADPTITNIDFLSNGFKLPTTWSGINGSGSTYYYMCFAESPFVSSKGIPTTAR
jgi:hypothetical protein